LIVRDRATKLEFTQMKN